MPLGKAPGGTRLALSALGFLRAPRVRLDSGQPAPSRRSRVRWIMFHETGAVTRFPSAVTPERPQTIAHDERTPPGEIFAVLWRRRIWIALGTVVGLIAAVAFLALVTPRYTAVAQILIDPNDLRVVDNAVTSSNAM